MDLKERLREQLTILTEASLPISALKGDGWNKAYRDVDIKDNKTAAPGGKLYKIRLQSTRRDPDLKKLGRNPDLKDVAKTPETIQWLKFGDGSRGKQVISAADITKSNFENNKVEVTSYEPDATVFEFNTDAERDAVIKALNTWRTRRLINFSKADAVEDDSPKPIELGEPADSSDEVKFTREELIKNYLFELFKVIKSSPDDIDGDYSYSKGDRPDSEVDTFYSNYLAQTDRIRYIVEYNKENPLWHNPVLTTLAYIAIHTGYTEPDLPSKVLAALNSNTIKEKLSFTFSFKNDLSKFIANKTLWMLPVERIPEYINMYSNLNGVYNPNLSNRNATNGSFRPASVGFFLFDVGTDEDKEKFSKYLKGDLNLTGLTAVQSLVVKGEDLEKTGLKPYNDYSSLAKRYLTIVPEGQAERMFLRYYYRDKTSSIELGSNDGNIYFVLPELSTSEQKFYQALADEANPVQVIFTTDDEGRTKLDITTVEPDTTLESISATKVLVMKKGCWKGKPAGKVELDKRAQKLKLDSDGSLVDLGFDRHLAGEGAEGMITGDLSIKDAKEEDAIRPLESDGEKMAKDLSDKDLLVEIEPDGTDDGEMIRGCTVSRGDIITGHDGNRYIVLKKNIGDGKWDVKSGTKILRWRPEVVKKIQEMGFSLNPGSWKDTGITAESLKTDLGLIHNDIND